MALAFSLMALAFQLNAVDNQLLVIFLFAFVSFAMNFGPNVATYALPTQCYPKEVCWLLFEPAAHTCIDQHMFGLITTIVNENCFTSILETSTRNSGPALFAMK